MKHKTLLFLHFLGAVMMGIFIYSPWREIDVFIFLIQGVIFPLLVLSGVWMRIRKFGK